MQDIIPFSLCHAGVGRHPEMFRSNFVTSTEGRSLILRFLVPIYRDSE